MRFHFRKGRKGALLVTALALLLAAPLLLAVTGCGGSSPQGAVKKYLDAWESHDWDAYLSSLNPAEKLNPKEEEWAKQAFEQINIKVDDYAMRTEYSKEDQNRAIVYIDSGKITTTASVLGEEKTETQDIENMEDSDKPVFDTIRVDGVWYVDRKPGLF